jgi:prepilin-type N-terminal cleavage/methylation domain-containing protein
MLTMKTSSTRAGYSLVEVLVATVLLGIVGGALTKLVIGQMRFFDNISANRGARSVARNSMNVLLSDLRMVQDQNGVTAATTASITVRVPYRFGVFCGTTAGVSGVTTVSMLPADSAVLALAQYAGYGWRDQTAFTYTVVTTATAPVTSAGPTLCTTTANINTITINNRAGAVLDITPPIPAATTPGTAVFFFQTITYSFAASTLFPGKIGLWRSQLNGVNEELMAPFDTSAKFKFYTTGADASSTTVPAPLDNIVGMDIVLTAVGTRTPAGSTAPAQAKMVSSVFFKNVRTP